MFWVLLEVLLAFGVAIFIVWWTFPKKSARDSAGASEAKPADGKPDA